MSKKQAKVAQKVTLWRQKVVYDAWKSTSFRRKNVDATQKKINVKKTGFCCTKKVSCQKKRFLLHKKSFMSK